MALYFTDLQHVCSLLNSIVGTVQHTVLNTLCRVRHVYREFATIEFPGLCPSAILGLYSVVATRVVSDTEVPGV